MTDSFRYYLSSDVAHMSAFVGLMSRRKSIQVDPSARLGTWLGHLCNKSGLGHSNRPDSPVAQLWPVEQLTWQRRGECAFACVCVLQDVADVGQLCEDVGRLFSLDMLLGEHQHAGARNTCLLHSLCSTTSTCLLA